MSKILTIILLVVGCLPSFAKAAKTSPQSQSEFFHQADAAHHELTPGAYYKTGTYKIKGLASQDLTGYLLFTRYEFGLSQMLSLGTTLTYSSEDNKRSGSTTTASGLHDLDLFLKGNLAAGPGTFRYGFSLLVSPGDLTRKSNGDSNKYSGRLTLRPYLGYEVDLSPCRFGGRISREQALGDGTEKSSTGTKKYSDWEETVLSLFYEHEFSPDFAAGVELDWVTTTNYNVKNPPSTIEIVSPKHVLRIYAPMPVATGTIIPELKYEFTSDEDINDSGTNYKIEKYEYFTFGASYRISF